MTILSAAHSKGKNKERASSVERDGGGSGVLLSMDMVSINYYAVAYTVPVQIGSSQQNFSLQVDTGSSDLWIASKSCSSASCSLTGGRLYDPSSSQSTGTTFTMHYLAGTVDGPIVWDQVQIGGYIVPNQALAAATTVNNEPLSYNYDGVLGLALPLNSLIQQALPTMGDAQDGATISSNIFSLAPATAPSQPFLSLALARPGSSQVPSLLGIGRHPPEIIPDPSRIRYTSLVSESASALFWKTTIRAITVYVNGQGHPIALQSLSGSSQPTALLDSGVPLIIMTPALANGIYGALGINPASNGNYYVPCTTPLNLTITLDGQSELPLHPLDLTVEPEGQSSSEYCTGLIQTDPSQLTTDSDIGDVILGVPFMRNVYTVLAYEQPDATGVFNNSVQSGTHPMLGLLGLTNATQAMEEFDQVRVKKQPLGSAPSHQSVTSDGDGSRLSIGVKVLIGLVGFFALCLTLFALRCFFARRRWRGPFPIRRTKERSNQILEYGEYRSTPNKPRSSVEDDYDLESSMWKFKSDGSPAAPEISDPWDPYAGTWRDTIVGTDAGEMPSPRSPYFPPPDLDLGSPHSSPEFTALLTAHGRDDSQTSDAAEFGMLNVGMAGVGTAARGSVIDAGLQHDRPSLDSMRSSAPFRLTTSSSRSSHTLASTRDSIGVADKTS